MTPVPGVVTSVLAGLPAVVDPEVTPQDGGSPGVLGFVFTFVLALALIVLALSLARQLRRVDHNARAADLADGRSEAGEHAASDGGAVAPAAPGSPGVAGASGVAGVADDDGDDDRREGAT